ncbi:MAG: hypothetical protein IKO68_00345 [Oscillospiraceae bacterium]|nr:hypothetical protein [Oscillospiraceae bacterium]
MELIITFAQELDEDLVDLLGIDEDTEFEAYFADGTLYVRPLTEDEEDELDWGCPVTDVVCDGDCENCPVYLAFENGSSAKPGKGQKGGD